MEWETEGFGVFEDSDSETLGHLGDRKKKQVFLWEPRANLSELTRLTNSSEYQEISVRNCHKYLSFSPYLWWTKEDEDRD